MNFRLSREDFHGSADHLSADGRRSKSAVSPASTSRFAERYVLLSPTAAAEWAGRGRVEAKCLAARNLEGAVAALDRGDLKLAALHATWTVATLSERRAELSRIALSVRRRLLGALSA